MTRVDFYILQKSESEEQRFDFSCRLLEKIVRQGNTVLVCTDSAQDSLLLDDLLWSFKPESYLPHAITGTEEAEQQGLPIVITHEKSAQLGRDVLLNLSTTIPEQFAQFARFAQVVNQAPEKLEASRRHFAFFKEKGYPIEVNKLNR